MNTDIVAVISKILKNDTTLMNMLPTNAPYGANTGAEAKKWSIIPAGLATGRTKPPFVTLQAGATTRSTRHTLSSRIYLRVYDDKNMGSANIAKINAQIYKLLDITYPQVQRGATVELSFENSLPQLHDESIQKDYVETQYKLEAL